MTIDFKYQNNFKSNFHLTRDQFLFWRNRYKRQSTLPAYQWNWNRSWRPWIETILWSSVSNKV